MMRMPIASGLPTGLTDSPAAFATEPFSRPCRRPGLHGWWLVRLLERAEHLGVLGDLLGSVNGSGRLVLVSGEAGVGKSALVERFCEDQAATGTRVLSGRCDDRFAPRPLAPLSDMARQVGGPLRSALDRGDQPAAFDAFLDFVSCGPRPQIVVLEDLQWADDATLDLLRFTARRLQQAGCLLIGTHRDDVALDHPLRRAIGSLTGPEVHRLQLSRLSIESVRALAAGRSIDPVALYDATAGNPFFVVQVLAGEPRAIRLVSADAAEWIGECATTNCTNATLCLDPFHIVRWATQALDVVRRWVWNTLRRMGLGDRAKQLKNGSPARSVGRI
jgi:hypothetical protein